MKPENLNIIIIGLSITSSWGNGHATTYRGLVRALTAKGHSVTFLEKDVPWYASNRDMPAPQFCKTYLYNDTNELKSRFKSQITTADLVIVGSYVDDGIEVGSLVTSVANGVTAFYDIDTPVTLEKLQRNDCSYLHASQIAEYDIYLSFTGGSTLNLLEEKFGARSAKALYCSFDEELYYPETHKINWELGYLGTYSDDRQPTLQNFLIDPASGIPDMKFVVAGPQYPSSIQWPENIERIEHLAPPDHRKFYNSQKFTLNVTRDAMKVAGYSPSVRLFEAAACATAIISDYWKGIDELFIPGSEILIAACREDVEYFLKNITEEERKKIGLRARNRVIKEHTAAHRAEELVKYYADSHSRKALQETIHQL